MSRYIDADKLMIVLNDWWYSQTKIESQNIPYDDYISVTIRSAMEAVKEQPTADVRENVRGEWIRRDSRYVGWISFDCSVCGETLELDRETSNDFKYCPFCGADMRLISALSENVEIVSNLKRGES